jgi:hypothetical protein
VKGFRGIGTFVLLLVLGLGITTYVVTRPPERGVDPEEERWIRGYVEWSEGTAERLDEAFVGSRPSTPAINDRVLEPLRTCADSLARVGPAPKSLRPVEQAAEIACGEMQYALDLNDQYGVSSIASTKQHLRGAAGSLDLAAGRIDNTLVIGKHLKTRSGSGGGSYVDSRLTRAATNATGQTVTVTCWSGDDWSDVRDELAVLDRKHRGTSSLADAGGVWLGAVHLAPATCASLEPILDHDAAAELDGSALVGSLAVLGHEAAHAAGAQDEVTAECRAVQYVRPLVTALDAAEAADALAGEAWQLYRTRSVRGTLWSADCRDGGLLDFHPGNTWP